jgi:O-acetyl-ADP-ribose deacetylase (regulator of RNase III)
VNGYNVSLWQGDITTLSCDVIVNAANKDGIGCFTVGHKCIDNIIHSKAGPRMRAECKVTLGDKKIETGELISTLGYNLPTRYVFHTVGPIGSGNIELIKCYLNCLKRARDMNLHSIAFCCISTGEYGFPQSKACFLALNSVKRWMKDNNYNIHVVFCVFKDDDYAIYSENIKKTF